MIMEHSRFEIWNQLQHVYLHSLSDFSYINGALPGVSNVEDALNYMTSAFYPKYVGTSATPALLPTGVDTPTLGDTLPALNDYRVVLDDGDAKQAGYRCCFHFPGWRWAFIRHCRLYEIGKSAN